MSRSATDSHGANGTSSKATPLSWDTFSNTIDGKADNAKNSRHGINPATEENSSTVPVATEEDVDRAMVAAKKAFKTWAAVPYAERQKAVLAFADALEAEKEGFSKLLTKEQGKPIVFAQMEIDAAVSWLRAAASHELAEERLEDDEKTILVRYTPLGVAVGIVPWNFPIVLACGKIGMSIVTGNPIIIKPSPFTPAGGLKLVELGQQFFPPGVLQGLSGDDNLGIWLTEHPTPAKISFTGSTATGKKVMASASKTLKRVTLELGGKDPAIVLDDVNIEEVAAKVATYAFLNSGQICIAIKRIYVHEKIIDEFRDAMVRYTKTLKLGEGNEEGVFLGPIQNKMQYDRVKSFFKDAESEKMNIAVGGVNPSGKGYFITPTIVDRPAEDSRLVVEEPFGPIVPLLSFRTDDEAIEKANNTFYGLGGSIWSSNLERANKMALKIEAGTVWVNTHTDLDPRVPFGGHKHSGMGAENGMAGLKSYCNSQTLFLRKK
ncbi:putative aldehyde dehydrogenase [Rhexocercosporidium sp. MPI-PUGE-AT-0058]|nr:putative aldehyde dehydrogenase [Rhexocercosporidium sp. MPI-PUGE-AT-0058]